MQLLRFNIGMNPICLRLLLTMVELSASLKRTAFENIRESIAVTVAKNSRSRIFATVVNLVRVGE